MSFNKAKESFNRKIKNANFVFISALLGTFITTIVMVYFVITGHTKNNLSYYLLTLNIPLNAPFLWMASSFSRKKNEYIRLQEEYSHKESVSKTYVNYRNQLEKYHNDDENKELYLELLKETLSVIAFNPSSTLEKNHHEKSIYDKLIDSQTEIVNSIINKKNKEGKIE